MEDYTFQLENDIKENYLSKKPIVKHIDDNISPKKNIPILKSNENFLTPLRNNTFMSCYTPETPYTRTPTQDPMIETPNGSKLFHPFISSIIRNLDKPMMSPDFFNKKERSKKDESVLSPDLAGELFPVEIDVDSNTQYRFEAALFKKYEKYLNKKSDTFFKKGTIAPSPENFDSGVGSSLKMSQPSIVDSDNNLLNPLSLFVHKTPPSKYKWNREEYRDDRASSPSIDFYDNDDDQLSSLSCLKQNLESTKIFDDTIGLRWNMSMRNHSVIVSPMFNYDDLEDGDRDEEMSVDREGSFDCLRSSPGWTFSCSGMEDLAMSPICGDLSTKRKKVMLEEDDENERDFGFEKKWTFREGSNEETESIEKEKVIRR